MSNYVKIQISPMYLHKAQNPRACHNSNLDQIHVSYLLIFFLQTYTCIFPSFLSALSIKRT